MGIIRICDAVILNRGSYYIDYFRELVWQAQGVTKTDWTIHYLQSGEWYIRTDGWERYQWIASKPIRPLGFSSWQQVGHFCNQGIWKHEK